MVGERSIICQALSNAIIGHSFSNCLLHDPRVPGAGPVESERKEMVPAFEMGSQSSESCPLTHPQDLAHLRTIYCIRERMKTWHDGAVSVQWMQWCVKISLQVLLPLSWE